MLEQEWVDADISRGQGCQVLVWDEPQGALNGFGDFGEGVEVVGDALAVEDCADGGGGEDVLH